MMLQGVQKKDNQQMAYISDDDLCVFRTEICL